MDSTCSSGCSLPSPSQSTPTATPSITPAPTPKDPVPTKIPSSNSSTNLGSAIHNPICVPPVSASGDVSTQDKNLRSNEVVTSFMVRGNSLNAENNGNNNNNKKENIGLEISKNCPVIPS